MAGLRLVACQIAIPPTRDAAARDAHLDRVRRLIAQSAAPGAQDVIVLPELSAIEYSDAAFDSTGRCEFISQPRRSLVLV